MAIRTGGLWSTTERLQHINQLARTTWRSICSPNICQRQTEHSCLSEDGQHDSHMLHQPHGGNKITEPVTYSMPALAIVPAKGHYTISRTPTGDEQCHSRQGIPHDSVVSRMDAGHNSVQENNPNIRTLLNRPVCIQTEQPVKKLRQLETRPLLCGHRCLPDFMERRARLCLSPIFPSWEMPAEDPSRGLYSHVDSTNLEQPWYPTILQLLIEEPVILPKTESLLTDPFNRVHPLVETGQLELAVWKVSGKSTLQKVFQNGLQISCWQDGAKGPIQHTSQPGTNGLAGVHQGRLIPFQQINSTFWIS